MPGRHFTNSNGYRYGFNGKENDKETSSQDYGFRIYNPSLGKFLSVDPLSKKYPELTPYQFASNRPIDGIDIDGLEWGAIDPMGMQTQSYYLGQIAEKNGEDPMKYIQKVNIQTVKGQLIGASTILGISYAPVVALRLGLIGAAMGTGISIVKGDNAYNTIKSAVSGFYGGVTLSVGGPATSLLGLAGKGALSGIVGDAAGQAFDNSFGNADGYDLGSMVQSGAIGSIANVVSSKLIDAVGVKINDLVSKAVTATQTEAYRNTIQKAIKAEVPGIGSQELKKAINGRIAEVQNLIKKQGEELKAGLQQAIERGTDILQDKANEKDK